MNARALVQRERSLLRRALEHIDARYTERMHLAPVGPLLYLGLARHQGAAYALSDGTRVEPGTWVGRLHFNNARAAAVEARTRAQAGIRFARLLRDSFVELAQRTRDETRFRHVQLYEGVTWLRAHGLGVGFEVQPLPRGPRQWLLSAHFRLLIWAFAPVATRAAMREVRPHRFRISREALQASFGSSAPTRPGAVIQPVIGDAVASARSA